MRIERTRFPGLCVVHPDVFGDERGYFMESYNAERYAEHGIDNVFVQDNHAMSMKKNVLRGLHFQTPPFAQSKLVRVALGSVWDVAVDLRKGSPTFGEWRAVELSEENKKMFFISKGFAHGYLTLSDNTIVQYKVDAYYSPEHDSGIAWNDPDLGIDWPLQDPVLSEKDGKLQFFGDFESPFIYDAGDHPG